MNPKLTILFCNGLIKQISVCISDLGYVHINMFFFLNT